MDNTSSNPEYSRENLSALNDQLQQKKGELAGVKKESDALLSRQISLQYEIDVIRQQMSEIQHSSLADGTPNTSLHMSDPEASIEALGLEDHHVALFGPKGLGFRTIEQFRNPQCTSNFIYKQLLDLLLRTSEEGKDLDRIKSDALAAIGDLQTRLRKKYIELDLS